MKTRPAAHALSLGLALLAAPLAGCPSSTDIPYCSKSAIAECRDMFDCCSGAQRETALGSENVNDQDKCKHDMEAICEQSLAKYLYAVEQGTVTYDETKGDACIKAYEHPDGQCSTFSDTSAADGVCKDIPFEGKQAVGSACHWDFECVTDSYCKVDTCTALAQSGESCLFVSCASGLYCSVTGTSLGTCASLKGQGDTCSSTLECQTGLYCDTQCKSPLSAGSVCTSNSVCDSGSCSTGTCSGTSQPCESDSSCYGKCTHGGAMCQQTYDCGNVCATSGNSCYSSASCNTATNEQCVADTCKPSTCTGRTCAPKSLVELDYCPLAN
jgi:hypothetical protein